MSLLLKLRCITVDVTGTLIAYKGELGDYYCMAAKSVGLPCPDYKRMHEGFKAAYTNMAKRYPCFGHAEKMPNIEWWRTFVKNSFIEAGYEYGNETFEKVFKRIYLSFGSSAPYTVFLDSQPFLKWARSQGLTIGIVSNAEYRYQDVILPELGCTRVQSGISESSPASSELRNQTQKFITLPWRKLEMWHVRRCSILVTACAKITFLQGILECMLCCWIGSNPWMLLIGGKLVLPFSPTLLQPGLGLLGKKLSLLLPLLLLIASKLTDNMQAQKSFCVLL